MTAASAEAASYQQILKSSSIIGGAQGINYLVGLARMKAVAVFLGPSGVGLLAIYQSIISVLATASALGINSSGVREIAEARAQDDAPRLASVVAALHRICWVTGIVGWAIAVAVSGPVSRMIFGNSDHAWVIAILGSSLLLTTITGGHAALLQGSRRIGDIARLNVTNVLLSAASSVALFAALGQRGIVPALLSNGVITLACTLWYSRRIKLDPIRVPWGNAWNHFKTLLGLGITFMWSALLTAIVTFAVRAIVLRQLGLDATGLYQASWNLSGLFAGFILSAMGTDFYPRLAAVASDHTTMNRLVNEQTEIGILLALPGLLATLALAPWVMHIFYTAEFAAGAALLPWFVLGVFGRVVSWPMGFVMIAKRESRWFAASETLGAVLQVTFAFFLIQWAGLPGVAIGFAMAYGLYVIGAFAVSAHLIGFRWSASVIKMLTSATLLVLLGFGAQAYLPSYPRLFVGVALSAAAAVFTLRGLATRLGPTHRLVRLVCRMPGGRFACGIQL